MYTNRAGQFIFRNNIQAVAYFKLELCRTDSNSKSTHKINVSPSVPPNLGHTYLQE